MFSKLTTKLLIDEIAQQPLARWFSGKGFTPQHLNGKLGILGVPFGKGQVCLTALTIPNLEIDNQHHRISISCRTKRERTRPD